MTQTEKPHEWALNPDNVKKVVYGMYGVVNEGGTGVRAKLPGIDVCGKTGSAQIASEAYEKAHPGTKDNAWFVAFAPCYQTGNNDRGSLGKLRTSRTIRRPHRARRHGVLLQ